MRRYRNLLLLAITTFFSILNCSDNPTEPSTTLGSVRLSITLQNVGELGKMSALNLQTLCIELTKGSMIVLDTIFLNGNSEIMVSQTYLDMSEGAWKLKADSRDDNGVIIHADSTEFTVIADQTVDVNFPLVSKYSMLTANFLNIAQDIYRVELIVDETLVADSTFPPRNELDFNISLAFDYLSTGTEHTICFEAFGEYEGAEYLFYSGDTSISIVPGENILYDVYLEWVGPYGGLKGDASIELNIGAIGTIVANGNFPLPGDILTDIDGNRYNTISIGNQMWMAENLRVTHYRDGTTIPIITSSTDWVNDTEGAYCNYNNANIQTSYGPLYNWYAVISDANIAPEGWHVATDADWKELEMALGMSQLEADANGWRGTNEGSKLASHHDIWNDGLLRDDPEFGTSGVKAIPGGYRNFTEGDYSALGIQANFWSTTLMDENHVVSRQVNYSSTATLRTGSSKAYGFSIRCVRD